MRTRAESGERVEPGYRVHKRQARCGRCCTIHGLLSVVAVAMNLTMSVPEAVTVTITISVR